MSVEENKALVRHFLDEVINGRDISVIPKYMVSGSMLAGAFEGFVTNYIQVGFPDFRLEIEDVFAEGDKVLVQTTVTATETGSVMGRLPSGKTYLSTVIYIFKIANGKVLSGQWVMDRMEIAQQLGWIPTPS